MLPTKEKKRQSYTTGELRLLLFMMTLFSGILSVSTSVSHFILRLKDIWRRDRLFVLFVQCLV